LTYDYSAGVFNFNSTRRRVIRYNVGQVLQRSRSNRTDYVVPSAIRFLFFFWKNVRCRRSDTNRFPLRLQSNVSKSRTLIRKGLFSQPLMRPAVRFKRQSSFDICWFHGEGLRFPIRGLSVYFIWRTRYLWLTVVFRISEYVLTLTAFVCRQLFGNWHRSNTLATSTFITNVTRQINIYIGITTILSSSETFKRKTLN